MRLIGSFHTMTIQGRSGSGRSSPMGRSTSTGAGVGAVVLTVRFWHATRARRPACWRGRGVLQCPPMRCSTCGAENRPSARFCRACGSTLALVCPNGHPVNPDDRFCDACGTAVSQGSAGEAAEPRGGQAAAERRLVSVLFADLVGFTPLSESRDAEEVREILSEYFERMRRVIEVYGGTVEKFIGDAVMAVWGTPVATEDDAERAVRAGLDLIAAVSALGDDAGVP